MSEDEDTNKADFTIVDVSLARELGFVTAGVLGAMWYFSRRGNDDTCRASKSEVSTRIGIEPRNLGAHYNKLIAGGYLVDLDEQVSKRLHRPRHYKLTAKAIALFAKYGEGKTNHPTSPDDRYDESSDLGMTNHPSSINRNDESSSPGMINHPTQDGQNIPPRYDDSSPNKNPKNPEKSSEPPPPRARDPGDDAPELNTHPVIRAIQAEHERSPLDGGYAWGGVWVQLHERGVRERIGDVLDKIRPEWVPRAFQLTDEKAGDPCLNYALSILARWARQNGPDNELAERINSNGKPKRQTTDRRGDDPSDDYPTLDPARFEPAPSRAS
jgi:hypothetical protein